jgi:hypothetical protein
VGTVAASRARLLADSRSFEMSATNRLHNQRPLYVALSSVAP